MTKHPLQCDCDACLNRRTAREKMREYRATPAGKESMRRQNEKRKEAIRAWHLAHPERVREVKRISERKQRTPEKMAFYNHRARSRRVGLPAIGVTASEWSEIRETFGGRCAYCNEPATARDHVDPLSRGGLDVADNVVVCCTSCNCKKHNKSLLQFVMSGGAQW